MRNIWFISDTHFNHEAILTFKDDDGNLIRNFDNVMEMNETMIERWNEVVKDGDKVYHLGDVFLGDKVLFRENWSRLKGRKRLVVGNHDDIKFLAKGGFFQKIVMWRKMTEYGVLLTHVPVHPTTLGEGRFEGKKIVNVHGHIHQNQSPEGNYKCVCVEHIDYRPVHMDEVRLT